MYICKKGKALIKTNVLDPPSYFVAGGRLAMVILVIFSYPLQAYPCRASLDKVLLLFQSSSKEFKTPPPPSPFKYFAMTTSILIASYIVSITVTKLDLVSNKERKRICV
jgi:hypothetical protein